MPHYKDGTPAAIGDHVTGKPYNTDHSIAGTVVSIKPGEETCNCVVAFVDVLDIKKPPYGFHPVIITANAQNEAIALELKTDYGETKAFIKVENEPQK